MYCDVLRLNIRRENSIRVKALYVYGMVDECVFREFVVFLITALVLFAFAANSLLCRWALSVYEFDPALFTLIRLVSGALVLGVLLLLTRKPVLSNLAWRTRHFWLLGVSLFVYALGFSMAYVQLDTGVGAFLLFATVQLSLQALAIRQGASVSAQLLLGLAVALGGLGLLLLPGGAVPAWPPVLIMLLSALGWALFVVLGKGSEAPLMDVFQAFVAASVMCIPAFGLLVSEGALAASWQGWGLAIGSGALASGVGYFGWYQVLPRLGIERAAQLQLLVPVVAVIMGVMVLSEPLSGLMVAAMGMIVVGVLIALRSRH